MTQNEEFALRPERLRALREARGLSQRELARQCGLGETLINKYENGNFDPSSTFLKRIADTLEVSTDYLLGRVNSPHENLTVSDLTKDELKLLLTYRREGWAGVGHLSLDKLTK